MASLVRHIGPNTLSTIERVKQLGPMQYIAKPKGAHLLQPNAPALTKAENHYQVLRLYRKIVRSVPRVLMAYEVTGGPLLEREAVKNIREHFERNRSVEDPGVIAVLRHKCEMEVSEALLLWKTKSHICNLVLNSPSTPIAQLMSKQQMAKNLPKQAQQSPFLSSFYQG